MEIEKGRTREIVIAAIERAEKDETFKQELLIDPLDAINAITEEKIEFPAGMNLVFVDQEGPAPMNTDTTYYLNIATFGNLEDMELTEEQLESIAGGGGQDCFPDLPPFIVSSDE